MLVSVVLMETVFTGPNVQMCIRDSTKIAYNPRSYNVHYALVMYAM